MGSEFELERLPDNEIIAMIEGFERNAAYAQEHYSEFARSYPGQFLAVYADGEVVIAPTIQEVLTRIPPDFEASAHVSYLDPEPLPFIL